MRTKCKRSHCSSSRRMLQGTTPLRSLSEKARTTAPMTSLLNECCKTPQLKPLSEKNKNMRRCHGFSSKGMRQSAALSLLLHVADLVAVRARKVMARRLPNVRTQKKKGLLREESKRQTSPSNISRSRFKSLRRKKKIREITSLSGSRQNSSVDRRSKKRGTAFRRRFKPAATSLRRRQ